MSDPRLVPDAQNPPDKPTNAPNADELDFLKARYDKELDAWLERYKEEWKANAAEVALNEARDDALRTTETASLKAIQDAYVTTAQSSLDRALTRMNVVTASVSAVTGIYTALLAYVYTTANTATGAANQPAENALTWVALIPALFLGLALFLVTIYAAMLRSKTTVGPFLPTGIGGQVAEMRLVTYMKWCFAGVLARRWALHAGIVSLGMGVATLPLPFIDVKDTAAAIIFGTGLVLVAGTSLFSWKASQKDA